MKRFVGFLIAAVFVTVIIGTNSAICFAQGPIVTIGTPLVTISKKADVVIMGTGFKAGKEITIIVEDKDGLQSDIGYALKPAPKADATGTWGTTWSAGSMVSKKIIGPGPCKILVTDADYNPIAHTVVYFQKAEKKK